MLVADTRTIAEPAADVAIVPMGAAAEAACLGLAATLRRRGLVVDMGYRGNMKKRMSRANDSGARFALIVGEEELAAGEAMVKDLVSGTQERLALHAIPAHIASA